MPSTSVIAATLPAPRRVTTRNGAEIVVLPTRPAIGQRGVVALQLWITAGAGAERSEEHGCAHLLEHMLFKPAAEGGRDLASAIEGLGGEVNAFTSHDETVVYVTVPAGRELPALESLLDLVLQPRLEPEVLALETQVVLEEIGQYRDEPGTVAMQALLEALYSQHPYGRPVLGTAAEIRRHDARRLRRFHRRVYAGRRARLVLVGPVDVGAVIDRARPRLEALPRGRALMTVEPVEDPLSRARVRVRQADVHEAHLQLGWRAPALPSPEACALEVASIVLGYGESSRLNTRVRRGDQLVTDIMATFYPSRHGSSLVISAHVEPARVPAATAAILAEVERLGRIPLGRDELDRARAVLSSDLVYRRETAQGHAHALGHNLSLGGSLELDQRYHQALAGLEPAAVQRACARWMRPRGAAVGVVIPRGAAARVRAMRAALGRCVRGRPSRVRPTALRPDRHGVFHGRLPGGLRVLAHVDPRVPMASGWLLWPGGLRLEDARRQGTTAMMARLLTRGCAAIDGDPLAREVEGAAAALDGFSSRNSAGLHFECTAPHLPAVLRRAIECAQAPRFALDELDEERRVALQDFRAAQDEPARLAFREALCRLYAGHPFRLRRHGTPASLARLGSRGLRETWARWYPLGRAVLAISGDVDLEVLRGILESLLSPAEPPPAPPWPGGSPRYPERPREVSIHREREQAHLVLAMPGLPFTDRSLPTLDVLIAVLGGQAGRLFMALREAEGLVYHVSASSNEGVDAGDVLFYAAAGPRNMARARAVLDAELLRITRERVRPEELERAQAWLVGQHEISMERNGRVASQLAFNEAFGLGRHAHRRYREQVERVTAAGLRALARRLLDPSRRIVSIVGP